MASREQCRMIWSIDGGSEVNGDWQEFEHESMAEMDAAEEAARPYTTFTARCEKRWVGIADMSS